MIKKDSFLKTFKPITPSLRHTCILNTKKLNSLSNKFKFLRYTYINNSGRNNTGKITVRHKIKKPKYSPRYIDFKYLMVNIPGIVKTIEFNKSRSSFISLIKYSNGILLYLLSPFNITLNQNVICSSNVRFENGSSSYIKYIPEGISVHNIEKQPGNGGLYIRAAGTYGLILSKMKNGFVSVKLPSKKIQLFSQFCKATVGIVSNLENREISLGKAGRSKWKGSSSSVRGVAMNPVDHPHGGGEGKKSKHRKILNYTGSYYKGKKKKKVTTSILKKPINFFVFF